MRNLVFVHFKSNLIFIQASSVFGAAWHIPEKKKKTAVLMNPRLVPAEGGPSSQPPTAPTLRMEPLGSPNPPSIGWHDGGSPLDAAAP